MPELRSVNLIAEVEVSLLAPVGEWAGETAKLLAELAKVRVDGKPLRVKSVWVKDA